MKTIIAGSRSLESLGPKQRLKLIEDAVNESGFVITEVVSGGCYGIDIAGENWANENKISVIRFLPDWALYGKSAGPKRNREMSKYAQALILVWDGVSRGSKNMLDEAQFRGLKVYQKKVL